MKRKSLFENVKEEIKQNPVVRRNELLIWKLIIAWLVIAVVILLKINYDMAIQIEHISNYLNNSYSDTQAINILFNLSY